jgi:Mn-dependent DtxR family transcriptional regulator
MPEPFEALTFPQRRALGELKRSAVRNRTAKSIFTRSDVLWRLEERGLVARNPGGMWHITPKGEAVYDAWMERTDG